MLRKLSRREVILLQVLGLVALVAGVYLLLQPQLAAYSPLKAELQDRQLQLEQAAQILRGQEGELAAYEESIKQLNGYSQLFASDFRNGSAMVMLGLMAADSNVAVNNLEPLGIIKKNGYWELPLKLELGGEYVNIAAYLAQIEKLPNLAEIRTLKVTAEAKRPPEVTKLPGEAAVSGALPQADAALFMEPKLKVLLDLVIYSDPSPEDGFYLEQEKLEDWKVGRDNPFARPEEVSPYPGVSP